MGRPRDKFLWEQVEESKNGWKCKYCNRKFEGSASRIRDHLSGQGNGISACKVVPIGIRNEALKKRSITMKRTFVREDNNDDSVNVTCPQSDVRVPTEICPWSDSVNVTTSTRSSKLDRILLTKGAIETYVTDALVKFFMCKQVSIDDFGFIKDPNFREFLERANQYEVPSSLLRGDSFVIEKLLVNIKEEVYQYLLMVKESWKTTGCTLMGFNLSKDNNYVLGFYCPKGFIFVEAPHDLSKIGDTLKQHSPSLDIDDVTHVIYHSDCSRGFPLCELSDQGSITWTTTVAHEFCSSVSLFPCLRHEIQAMCIELCEGSEWALSLIKKAERMHKCINDDPSLRNWYYKIVKEKGFKGFEDGNILSRFLSTMLLEDDLKTRLSYHLRFEKFIMNRVEIESILDDSEFWGDGRELERVLTDVLKICDFMDTLVPSACYVDMVIDKVKHIVFNEDQRISMQNETFWHDLYSDLSRIIVCKQVVAYLNPFYFLQGNVEEKLKLIDKVKLTLRDLVREEEQDTLDEQLQSYNDECNKMFVDIDELEIIHPVKWWEQHGNDLPLLRKYAIKMLSQPVTCMCNQVNKCMFQLEVAEDYILRLNVRMMEEFRNLGANIYKPLDLKAL